MSAMGRFPGRAAFSFGVPNPDRQLSAIVPSDMQLDLDAGLGRVRSSGADCVRLPFIDSAS